MSDLMLMLFGAYMASKLYEGLSSSQSEGKTKHGNSKRIGTKVRSTENVKRK